MQIFVVHHHVHVHLAIIQRMNYYRARMLHAAILAELLPNGHDGVRQKFAYRTFSQYSRAGSIITDTVLL